MTELSESLQLPSDRFRAIFYYVKWINLLMLLGAGFSNWFGYISVTQVYFVWLPVFLEHIILYLLRRNENQQWEVYYEKSALIYRKEREERQNLKESSG